MEITTLMLILKIISGIIFLIAGVIALKNYVETRDLMAIIPLFFFAFLQTTFLLGIDYLFKHYNITYLNFSSGSTSALVLGLQIYLLFYLATSKR